MSEPGAPQQKLKASGAPHRGVETDGQDVVMEMIRLSLEYRSGGKGLTRTGVQKVLYELKRSLPEGHRVGESLPYYWFKAGPFSEHVARALMTCSPEARWLRKATAAIRCSSWGAGA